MIKPYYDTFYTKYQTNLTEIIAMEAILDIQTNVYKHFI